jgi:hypothetical protein
MVNYTTEINKSVNENIKQPINLPKVTDFIT